MANEVNISSQEEKKRPMGVTILAILWSLGSITNLLNGGSTILRNSLIISYEELFGWFRFAIPAEMAISMVAFVLGIVQLYVVYGLIKGRSWSYKLSLFIPIIYSILSGSNLLLYSTCPSYLVQLAEFSIVPKATSLLVSFFVASVVWSYLRRSYVKAFFGIK